ncbi:MAG: trypsin-like peptidase domain-containing protein [Coleofasciculaceae cyanobacterium SM2_1_6]|nr:trypsin-like peptidase domain-containing protein [Coleofasciculaceae cyanobacterium SM2_1_6]
MKSNYYLATFIGAAAVVSVAQSSVTQVSNLQQIRQSLVLIQNPRGENRGTGFIVAKDGNTYYALTAEHVVREGQFQVRTDAAGEVLPIELVLPLPSVNLALVQFTSTREYPLTRLARDAIRVTNITQIFILGYPTRIFTNPQILTGNVTSRQPLTTGSGNAIFHDVDTLPGMSGSPVFTTNGEVIGIHLGINSLGNFREAIPIEKYWELVPQIFIRAGRDNLAVGNFPKLLTVWN